MALKFDNCGIIARGQINQQSVIKTLKLRNWRHDKLLVIYTEDLPQWLDIHPSIDRDETRTHNHLIRKRMFNYLAKLAKRVYDMIKTDSQYPYIL